MTNTTPTPVLRTVSFALLLLAATAAHAADLTPAQKESLPPDVRRTFSKQGLEKTYSFTPQLNPFYLQGDFNGDGKLDTAVLLRSSSGKTAVAVFHGGGDRVVVLGGGTPIPGAQGADSFDWMDAWYAYAKGPTKAGPGKGKPPVLKGDALHVAKSESASAIIYWDGSKYQWFQQGD